MDGASRKADASLPPADKVQMDPLRLAGRPAFTAQGEGRSVRRPHLVDAVQALLICFSAEDQEAAGHQRY